MTSTWDAVFLGLRASWFCGSVLRLKDGEGSRFELGDGHLLENFIVQLRVFSTE